MKLADVLLSSSFRYPEKTALYYQGKSYSYATVSQRVAHLAAAMANQAGVRPGDRIGVWCANCPEYIEVVFAASMVGAIPELYNARWSCAVVDGLLKDGGVGLVFVGADDSFRALAKSNPGIDMVAIRGRMEGAQDYESFLSSGVGKPFDPVEMDPRDTALHLFTSGTTSTPKCVMVSCESVILQTMLSSTAEGWTPDDACLCCFPFFHVSGFSIYKAFYNAALLVIGCSTDIKEIGDLISRCHVTRAALVPVMLKSLLDLAESGSVDLSSLSLITYGSTHVSPELLKRCAESIGCGFYQAYGMTESAGPVTVLLPAEHGDESLLETAGKPLPGADVRIIDEEGRSCPPGEHGEIFLRSYTMMKGYRNKPELTSEVMADGWYATRDMGFMDARGYLHVVGRKDGMIISGGENIFPQEISDCIARMEGVLEVAVVGASDGQWGQRPVAFVVKKEESNIQEQDIMDYCARRLARYKKPRDVYFLDMLPRGGMGKVSEKELKALAEARSAK